MVRIARLRTSAEISVIAVCIRQTHYANLAILQTLRQHGVQTRGAARLAAQLDIARFRAVAARTLAARSAGSALPATLAPASRMQWLSGAHFDATVGRMQCQER